MTYCFQCGHTTPGTPLFCQHCGRTYNVKLCPRLHPNPRWADVCAQCGSRELSTPQPRVSVWWKVLELLLQAATGCFLAVLSIFLIVAFLKSPQGQTVLITLALLILALWALWSMIPEWLRKLIHQALKRKEHRHEK